MNYQPQLEFPFDEAPAPGTRINLIEGIDWVYQPLPFRLNHVNCWWLDGGDGHCVQVDTGIASDTTRKHWKTALSQRASTTQQTSILGTCMRSGINRMAWMMRQWLPHTP